MIEKLASTALQYAPAAVSVGMQMAQNAVNRNWQEKMYNQYQSPAAMVRQYKEAGLNPALMYGQNLQTEFNQPATQNQIDPIGAAYTASQLKNLQAQTDNLNADTQAKLIENEFKPDLLYQNLKQGWLDYDNTLAGIHKINAEIREMDSRTILNTIQSDLTEAQIDNILANTDKTRIEAANEALRSAGIEATNRLVAAQVVTEQMKPALQAAEITLMESQKYSYEVGANRTIEETNSISYDNFEKEWRNNFIKINGYEPSTGLFQSLSTSFGTNFNRKKFSNEFSKGGIR